MSTPATATTANSGVPAQTNQVVVASQKAKPQEEPVIPSAATLQNAAKLAIQQDKKIMLDYYVESLSEKAFIGEDATSKDRVLIKTRKDFTSLVQKLYKTGDDFLIMTENSIYIVSSKIKKRPINLANLDYDYNDEE
jgi:hypothetical protein